MAGPSSHPPEDEAKKIADADWLVGDKPRAKPRSAPAAPSRPTAADDHSYDVIGEDEAPSSAPAPVPPPVAPRKPTAKAPKPKGEGRPAEPAGPPASVDEVWTRGAEWGGSLIAVGAAALATGVLVYFALSSIRFFLAFLLAGLGGAVMLVLCYPIFITLERPVRITPEQAAKDYYAMLSHLRPHYPRMWLLLSSAGRASPEFSSLGGFKAYWGRALSRLAGGSTLINPLQFRVEDFHSEKSAGLTSVNAKFTVKVYRGEPESGAEVGSYLITTGLVKGPDRMWYLNDGRLPIEGR